VTLTYPALDSARSAAFLVAGADKTAALKRVLAGDRDLPAARIAPVGELIWFVDRAALGET
jgi:6-phosphogluconolactonase